MTYFILWHTTGAPPVLEHAKSTRELISRILDLAGGNVTIRVFMFDAEYDTLSEMEV